MLNLILVDRKSYYNTEYFMHKKHILSLIVSSDVMAIYVIFILSIW